MVLTITLKKPQKSGRKHTKNKHKNYLIKIPQNGKSLKYLRGKLSREEKCYCFLNELRVGLLFPAADVTVSIFPSKGRAGDEHRIYKHKFIYSTAVHTVLCATLQTTKY